MWAGIGAAVVSEWGDVLTYKVDAAAGSISTIVPAAAVPAPVIATEWYRTKLGKNAGLCAGAEEWWDLVGSCFSIIPFRHLRGAVLYGARYVGWFCLYRARVYGIAFYWNGGWCWCLACYWWLGSPYFIIFDSTLGPNKQQQKKRGEITYSSEFNIKSKLLLTQTNPHSTGTVCLNCVCPLGWLCRQNLLHPEASLAPFLSQWTGGGITAMHRLSNRMGRGARRNERHDL